MDTLLFHINFYFNLSNFKIKKNWNFIRIKWLYGLERNDRYCLLIHNLFRMSIYLILSCQSVSSAAQSCPTLCDPHGLQHARPPYFWELRGQFAGGVLGRSGDGCSWTPSACLRANIFAAFWCGRMCLLVCYLDCSCCPGVFFEALNSEARKYIPGSVLCSQHMGSADPRPILSPPTPPPTAYRHAAA